MILHPGVLALLVGSAVVLAMLLLADWIGLQVLARWDFASSSQEQLALERQTYLVSTLTAYALGFEIVSALLFVYTAEDVHDLFVGAMCATGSLNANPVGWSALLVKLVITLVCPLWIAVNHLDQSAGDFPIVRAKYIALLVLTPLVAADLVLQVAYFTGLDPEIITSCCGALFNESGGGVASELASLPVVPMMWAFYLAGGSFLGVAISCLLASPAALRFLLLVLSLVLLAVALAAIVAFISLYVYQLPTHHCPFDMLQANHYLIGYPLYISLFAGVVFGMLPGLLYPLRRINSLENLIAAAEKKWLRLSIGCIVCFLVVASLPIALGTMRLVIG